MPAYLVGTVRITDPEQFTRYASAVKGLAARFGGEPVVAGAVGRVIEGASPVGERVVVTRFASAAEAMSYVESDEYRTAQALREGVADVELRLVEI